MSTKSDKEKLQILLAHWIEHNQSHAAEMTKWRQVAADNNLVVCARLIDEAVSGIETTDKALEAALEEIGGAPHGTHHHHHH